MPVRLVTRTDVHVSDHNPSSRLDNWTETVLEKLLQVAAIAQEVEADAVLDNGDLFDVKSPSRNSHELVRSVADVHTAYPCPVYGNVGNHDCVYGNIEFLPQQPLGVLFSSGVLKRCYSEHEALIEKDDVRVRICGVPYHGTSYDLERLKFAKKGEDRLVVMAHLLASPKGGKMFEGEDIVKYDDLTSLAPEVDVWVFGHWHKDQGIQRLSNGALVVNVGALTRGSLSQDSLERIPSVGIVTLSKTEVVTEQRFLKVKPWSEVFDVEQRVRTESRAMTMDHYVESLSKSLEEIRKGESLRDKIRRADVPEAVREKAILFVEQAGGK